MILGVVLSNTRGMHERTGWRPVTATLHDLQQASCSQNICEAETIQPTHTSEREALEASGF